MSGAISSLSIVKLVEILITMSQGDNIGHKIGPKQRFLELSGGWNTGDYTKSFYLKML